MAWRHMHKDADRVRWRWVAALFPLVMVAHEAHESAHTLVGRIVCGQWAQRDFNRWSIGGDCDSAWPTLAGPLCSYLLMLLGFVLLRRRMRWPGLALIFAANPLARMVTAAMGRGDEAFVARAWFGAHVGAGWLPWLSGMVVMLLGGAALLAAWRGLEGVRARRSVFAGGAIAAIAVTGLLLPVLNRLLQAGVLAVPVAGAPLLVHVVTAGCLVGLALSLRWLANSPGAGEPAAVGHGGAGRSCV